MKKKIKIRKYTWYRVEWKNVCAAVRVSKKEIDWTAPVLRWMLDKTEEWLLNNSSFTVIKLNV